MAVKANAIRNHSNPIRSAAIAEEFNLDIASMNIDDQEGLSDEDEDLEPYVHTGLASSGESYQEHFEPTFRIKNQKKLQEANICR